jgi:hypothetical protein
MGDAPQAHQGDKELLEQHGPRAAPSPAFVERHRRLMAMLRRMQGEAWSPRGTARSDEAAER